MDFSTLVFRACLEVWDIGMWGQKQCSPLLIHWAVTMTGVVTLRRKRTDVTKKEVKEEEEEEKDGGRKGGGDRRDAAGVGKHQSLLYSALRAIKCLR